MSALRGEDLASRAVRAMATATGREPTAFVQIRKRVPGRRGPRRRIERRGRRVARARGDLETRRIDLVALAATVGSDVPFFASGARVAYVGGRGERVEALPDPAATHLVLVRSLLGSRRRMSFAELGTADRGRRRPSTRCVTRSRAER